MPSKLTLANVEASQLYLSPFSPNISDPYMHNRHVQFNFFLYLGTSLFLLSKARAVLLTSEIFDFDPRYPS